jgi:microcystin-dependent protein
MTVLGQVAATTDLADAVWPAGTMLPFAGDTAPAGWILCDGQTSVSPTSALGVALGGASGRFGADASGNPKVPDMRGRVPIGFDLANIGSVGGAVDHTHGPGTLSMAAHGHTHNLAMPSHGHGHSFYVGNHNHGINMVAVNIQDSNDDQIAVVTASPTGDNQPGVGGSVDGPTATGASGSVSTATPGVTGATAPANAPMQTFLYIIKT